MEVEPSAFDPARPGFVPQQVPKVNYKKGEHVEVFYKIAEDTAGFFPVAIGNLGSLTPRVGMTDGWMAAYVEDDFSHEEFVVESARKKKLKEEQDAAREAARHHRFDDNRSGPPPNPPPTQERIRPRDHWVLIRHTHPLWFDRQGVQLNVKDRSNMVLRMHPQDIRKKPKSDSDYQQHFGVPRAPKISFLEVRWGGKEDVCTTTEQWGHANSSVHDMYIELFYEKTVYNRLGPDYEVITAWISSSHDFAKLNAAHLLSQMRGKYKAALYHLWPVNQQDGLSDQPGMIESGPLFQFMASMEGVGIPTRHPHPSHLYNTLVSKNWQPNMCLYKDLSVPVCVTVNRSSVMKNSSQTAGEVLSNLKRLIDFKGDRHSFMDEIATKKKPFTGVVKLGFAWEAAHVVQFKSEKDLEEAMVMLSGQPGSYNTTLLVQEYVNNMCEFRVYVIDGKPRHIIYSSFAKVENGYFMDFIKNNRDGTRREWFKGDESKLAEAEKKCNDLVEKWLAWLSTQTSERIPAIRMDFLVNLTPDGKVEVHTLELTDRKSVV